MTRKQVEKRLRGIGGRIRKARIASNMSQSAIGKVSGVSESAIGHIENGRRLPSIETAALISAATGTSLDLLVFGEGVK